MKRIYNVVCPACGKNYYITGDLYKEVRKNSKLKLQCPYCKRKFFGQKAFIQDHE